MRYYLCPSIVTRLPTRLSRWRTSWAACSAVTCCAGTAPQKHLAANTRFHQARAMPPLYTLHRTKMTAWRPLLDWHPVPPCQLHCTRTTPSIDKLRAVCSAQGQPTSSTPTHLQPLPCAPTAGRAAVVTYAAASAVYNLVHDARGSPTHDGVVIHSTDNALETHTKDSSLSTLLVTKTRMTAPLVHRARRVVLYEATAQPNNAARPDPPAMLKWCAVIHTLAHAHAQQLQLWEDRRATRAACNAAVLAEHTAIQQRFREARYE